MYGSLLHLGTIAILLIQGAVPYVTLSPQPLQVLKGELAVSVPVGQECPSSTSAPPLLFPWFDILHPLGTVAQP